MEEISTIFIQFLERIYQSELETNQLLVKFNKQPDAAQFIFKTFTKEKKQTMIDVHDMTEYFLKTSVSKKTVVQKEEIIKILSNYFKFSNSGKMHLITFRNALLPKIHTLKNQFSAYEEGIQEIFALVVCNIITGFKEIQEIRKNLCTHRQQISQYFRSQYDSGERLTKQILRDFMFDHRIYLKQKFQWITWYIFGDCLQAIEWDLFLSIKGHHSSKIIKQQEQEDYQPLLHEKTNKNQSTSYKQINICVNNDETTHQIKPLQPKGCQQSEGIKELFEQIDILEQKLNNKKSERTNRSFKPEQKQKKSKKQQIYQAPLLVLKESQLIEKEDFKITRKNSAKQRYSSEQKHVSQKDYIQQLYQKYTNTHYASPSNTKNNWLNTTKSAFNNWMTASHPQDKENYYQHGSKSKSKKIGLNKSASEAKLKIAQIEKKVNRMMGPKYSTNSYTRGIYQDYNDIAYKLDQAKNLKTLQKKPSESTLNARRYICRI